MTALVLTRRRNTIFISVIISFLVPVAWILFADLEHRLEDARTLSRIQAQMLAENAARLFHHAVHPDDLIGRYRGAGIAEANLIALYNGEGRIIAAGSDNEVTAGSSIDDAGILSGLDSAILHGVGIREFETEEMIGTVFPVPDYPHRFIVAYDREKIVRSWALGVFPIVFAILALVTIILLLTKGIHREVTNRFREEERRAQEGLRYLESLRVMAGGLAHHVNNQMMVVIGNTDILTEEVGDTQHIERFTRAIKTAAERASDLSTRMLATAGTAVIHLVPHTVETLGKVLKDAIATAMDSSAPVELEMQTEARRTVVPLDPELVKIALVDLVKNGLDAGDDDAAGEGVTVSLSVTEWDPDAPSADPAGRVQTSRYSSRIPAGRYLSVSVGDRGRGIPPQTMKHLFEPFYTTGHIGGGLGLSAVAGIAHQHGGGVVVRSRDGVGTTVTMLLALASPDAPPRCDQVPSRISRSAAMV